MTKTPSIADMFAQFQPETFKDGFEKAQSFWMDMGQLNKDGLVAMSESAKLASKGFEAMTERTAAFMKSNVEAGLEVSRTMSEIKTFQDAFEMQSSLAQSNIEKYVSEAGAMSSLMAETARAASEPINAHFEIVVDKVQTIA